MAEARVASRYAEALYSVASQHNIVSAVSDDLDAIATAAKNDRAFQLLLSSPSYSMEMKHGICERIFSDRVTALTMQLIRLLLDKRREDVIPEIAKQFNRLRREHGNIAYIEVTSAQPLSDQERAAIEKKVALSTGKQVESTYYVDASQIGGVKVGIGNYVLDGTVLGSLQKLRERLTYDLLKQI